MDPIEKRAFTLALFATLIVSTSFPVGAAITQGMDSVLLTFLRFCISIAILGPLLAWKVGIERPSLKDFARYAIVSAFLVAFFVSMFEALRFTTPLNTATIFTIMPIFGALMTFIMLKEMPSTRTATALGLGLIGAVWVIFRGDFTSMAALSFNKGDLIFLGGTLAMGIYGPLIKALHRGEPMLKMTFWVQIMGTLWLFLFSAPLLGDMDWAAVPSITYMGIAYLGIATALTFFVFQWSTLIIGPTKVMSFTYLNPALVLMIGLMLGHDAPPLMTYPGLLLAVGATIVLQRAPRKLAKAKTGP